MFRPDPDLEQDPFHSELIHGIGKKCDLHPGLNIKEMLRTYVNVNL
jgi:hypothetical protein